MKSGSNIDKLFREGLNNPQHHAFNEGAWSNMESMLNQKDRMSWMSVGRLSAAALFLSTLFVASSGISEQALLAENNVGQNTAKIVDQPVKPSSSRLIIADNSDSRSEVEKTLITNESPIVAEIAENGAIKTNPDMSSGNSKIVDNDVSLSSFKAVSKVEDKEEIGNAEMTQMDPRENLTLAFVEPKSLSEVDVDMDAVGFDPVDAANLPKTLNQSISVFAGITLENGLGSSQDITANNLLYTAGMYYTVGLGNDVSISTGLGYRSKSGKGIDLSRTQTEYGFGKTSTTETLSLDRLHYVDLPIELSYDIKGKHSVIAGASVSYLVGVKSAIETKNEESLHNPTTQSENTWDYRDGLNNLDANLRVGYDYKLNTNLSIGGMVQYGLMDITSNETFQVVDNSKNVEVRVTLKYTPFRF